MGTISERPPLALDALRRAKKLVKIWPEQLNESPLIKYAMDPVGYARDVLRVNLHDRQQEIIKSLVEPPYRTLVKSAHNVGKSFTAAVATCWWYDTRPRSVAITTAPTARDVRDILWKEIRVLRQRAGLGGFAGVESPMLKDGPDHYAKGYTTDRGESFQGRHDLAMLFIFDEAVGIPGVFWTTTNTMFKPGEGHAWLAIFNPTDTTSQAYQEEGLVLAEGPKWRSFTMSALDHPNVLAQSRGQPPPYPSAVSIAQILDAIHEGCERVTDHHRVTDFEFPLKSGQWWRPGPIFQSRWLGVWPDSSDGVWSDALWKSTLVQQALPGMTQIPQLGCDVARHGQDWTVFHVRWGNSSVHHGRVNGWSTMQTAGELVRLAKHWSEAWNDIPKPGWAGRIEPHVLQMNVDDDGVGGGVCDRLEELGMNVVMIRAGTESDWPDKYPNVRSQLWFDGADMARAGKVDLSRLTREHLVLLKQQAMAPNWKLDSQGRRVVEKKDDTKKKIGCSPDDMDAFNLAYYRGRDVGTGTAAMVLGRKG